MFVFDFGYSDDGRNISREIQTRMMPSLAIALPTFFVGLLIYIYFRAADDAVPRDRAGHCGRGAVRGADVGVRLVLHHRRPIHREQAVALGADFRLCGRAGQHQVRGAAHHHRRGGQRGSSSRWYRTIFLEEIGKDYVRTARAKGVSELRVLFRHVLKNAMIPILTGVVVVIPLLFMGSLLTESFFGIPGLGSYTIDAINAQDFGVVRAMVFLGSVLYIVGLILTDVSYTVVDPRVRLQ